MTPPRWATRMLFCLLREADADALLGDLGEEYRRRSQSQGFREARRRYHREVYFSLAATLRMRVAELVRSAPWRIAIGAYVLVGAFEIALRLMLSRTWPEAAQPAALWRLVFEFPVVAFIAYGAAGFHRAAPFVLGAMMLCAALLLSTAGAETVSTAYALAFLTLGPLAAVLGGMLHRARRRI